MINRFLNKASSLGWLALVVLLPITSMPLVVRLVRSDVVASPSILFLALLLAAFFLPYIWKNGALPRQSLPLLFFVLAAVFSTALAGFIFIPPYKDISPLRNSISSVATLTIGVGFYLVTSVYPRDRQKVGAVLRLLNWSGLVVLLWALVQTVVWYGLGRYPEWLRTIHAWYSVGTLFRQRTTGFALEPSWLAHQLNLLFLPFWLAAAVRRTTAHRFRIAKLFILEDVLLGLGMVVLWFTLSRVGLFAFLLMIAYLLIRANLWLKARLQDWLLNRWQKKGRKIRVPQRVISGVLFLLMALAYLGLFLGVGVTLSKVDPRMEELFNFSFSESNPVLAYANALNFSSRLVYWEGGWNIFNDYPWFGVGLGNAGFFFPQSLSGYAWWLVEVRDLVFRTGILLNVKSMWVRLLTETGIVGFSLFSTWFFLIWQTGRALETEADSQSKMMALAAQLLVIGYLVEGFSVDSFAIPYLWFSSGLVTAAHFASGSGSQPPDLKGDQVEE